MIKSEILHFLRTILVREKKYEKGDRSWLVCTAYESMNGPFSEMAATDLNELKLN